MKLAAGDSIFGNITNPLQTINPSGYGDVAPGLPNFISNVLRLIFVVGGIAALLAFLIAGLNYITAGGDEGKIKLAIQQINFSLIGLAILAAAIIVTGVVSYLLFGRADAILNPTIYGPGSI